MRQLIILLATITLPVMGIAQNDLHQKLQNALENKDTATAMQLIHEGASVNALDQSGSSILMSACRWADKETIAFLVNHGATIDEPRSSKGRTALMIACAYYSGVSISKLLIDKGANVNAISADGKTPLMLAAQNAKIDVVKLLLQKGADPDKKDANGKNALYYAKNASELDYVAKAVKDAIIDQAGTIRQLEAVTKL